MIGLRFVNICNVAGFETKNLLSDGSLQSSAFIFHTDIAKFFRIYNYRQHTNYFICEAEAIQFFMPFFQKFVANVVIKKNFYFKYVEESF